MNMSPSSTPGFSMYSRKMTFTTWPKVMAWMEMYLPTAKTSPEAVISPVLKS